MKGSNHDFLQFKIIFSEPETIGACYSSYAENEIKMSDTSMKIDDGFLSVQGLSDTKYLACLREGKLIFPSNPVDQTAGHQFKVFLGDEFVWFKFKGFPPQPFLDKLFAQNKPTRSDMIAYEEEATETAFFTVTKSAIFTEKVKSKIASWNRFCSPVITTFAVFLLIAIIALVVYFTRSVADCLRSDTREYYWLSAYNNMSGWDFEVDVEVESCTVTPFNMTEHLDRFFECFRFQYPRYRNSSWEMPRLLGGPQYLDYLPSYSCSLPPRQ